MQEELEAHKKNGTWKLVKSSKNVTVMQNKWGFKMKYDQDEKINKHKARLVVKGYMQKEGEDYSEIFSPVARFESIRMMLAIAAAKKMHKKQFDVKTAFLNGTIKEDIYMEQPHGFEDGSNKICKLHKSLYGLKQAARCWNEKLVQILKEVGLHQTSSDTCVFVNQNCETILAIYVDDGLIISSNKEEIARILKFLKQKFEIKTNTLNLFLGMEINTRRWQHHNKSVRLRKENCGEI